MSVLKNKTLSRYTIQFKISMLFWRQEILLRKFSIHARQEPVSLE